MDKNKSKKRVSILKTQKPDKEDGDEDTNVVRKVRFSSNFVKEFVPVTDGDEYTLWNATYEEEIEKSSTLSSQSHSNSIHASSSNITLPANNEKVCPNIPPSREDKNNSVPRNQNLFYPSFSNKTPQVPNAEICAPRTNITTFLKKVSEQRANKNADRKSVIFGGQGDGVDETKHSYGKGASAIYKAGKNWDLMTNSILNTTSIDCDMDLTNSANEGDLKSVSMAPTNQTKYDAEMNITEIDGGIIVQQDNRENKIIDDKVTIIVQDEDMNVIEFVGKPDVGNKTSIFKSQVDDDLMEQTCVTSSDVNAKKSHADVDEKGSEYASSRNIIHFNEASPNANMDFTAAMGSNQTIEMQNKTRIFDSEMLGTSMEQTCEFPLQMTDTDRQVDEGKISLLKSFHATDFKSKETKFLPENTTDYFEIKNVVQEVSKVTANKNINASGVKRKTFIFNTTVNNGGNDTTNVSNEDTMNLNSMPITTNRTTYNADMDVTEIGERNRTRIFDPHVGGDVMEQTCLTTQGKSHAIFTSEIEKENKTQMFDPEMLGTSMEQTSAFPLRAIVNTGMSFAPSDGNLNLGDAGTRKVKRTTIHFNTTLNNGGMDLTNVKNVVNPSPVESDTEIFNPPVEDHVEETCQPIFSTKYAPRRTIHLHDDMDISTAIVTKETGDVENKTQIFDPEMLGTSMEETCAFPLRPSVNAGISFAPSDENLNLGDAGTRKVKRTTINFNTTLNNGGMDLTNVRSDVNPSPVESDTGIFNPPVEDDIKETCQPIISTKNAPRRTVHLLDDMDTSTAIVTKETGDVENKTQIFDPEMLGTSMEQTCAFPLRPSVNARISFAPSDGNLNLGDAGTRKAKRTTIHFNTTLTNGGMDLTNVKNVANPSPVESDTEMFNLPVEHHVEETCQPIFSTKYAPRKTIHFHEDMDISTAIITKVTGEVENKTQIFDPEMLGTSMEQTCAFPLRPIDNAGISFAPSDGNLNLGDAGTRKAKRTTIHFNATLNCGGMDLTNVRNDVNPSPVENDTGIFNPPVEDDIKETCQPIISTKNTPRRTIHLLDDMDISTAIATKETGDVQNKTQIFDPEMLGTSMEQTCVFPLRPIVNAGISFAPSDGNLNLEDAGKRKATRRTTHFNATLNCGGMDLTNVRSDDVNPSPVGNDTGVFNTPVEEDNEETCQPITSTNYAPRATIHIHEDMDISTAIITKETGEVENKTRIFDPAMLGITMEQTCEFPLSAIVNTGGISVAPTEKHLNQQVAEGEISNSLYKRIEGDLERIVKPSTKISINSNTTSNKCDMDLTNVAKENVIKHPITAKTNHTTFNAEMNMTEVGDGGIIQQDYQENIIKVPDQSTVADKTQSVDPQVERDLTEQACARNYDIPNADKLNILETVENKNVSRNTINFHDADMDVTAAMATINISEVQNETRLFDPGMLDTSVEQTCAFPASIIANACMPTSRRHLNFESVQKSDVTKNQNQTSVENKTHIFDPHIGSDIMEEMCVTSCDKPHTEQTADLEGKGTNILQIEDAKCSSWRTIYFNETSQVVDLEEACAFPLDSSMPVPLDRTVNLNVGDAFGKANLDEAACATNYNLTSHFAEFSKVVSNEKTEKPRVKRRTINFNTTSNNCDMNETNVANENVAGNLVRAKAPVFVIHEDSMVLSRQVCGQGEDKIGESAKVESTELKLASTERKALDASIRSTALLEIMEPTRDKVGSTPENQGIERTPGSASSAYTPIYPVPLQTLKGWSDIPIRIKAIQPRPISVCDDSPVVCEKQLEVVDVSSENEAPMSRLTPEPDIPIRTNAIQPRPISVYDDSPVVWENQLEVVDLATSSENEATMSGLTPEPINLQDTECFLDEPSISATPVQQTLQLKRVLPQSVSNEKRGTKRVDAKSTPQQLLALPCRTAKRSLLQSPNTEAYALLKRIDDKQTPIKEASPSETQLLTEGIDHDNSDDDSDDVLIQESDDDVLLPSNDKPSTSQTGSGSQIKRQIPNNGLKQIDIPLLEKINLDEFRINPDHYKIESCLTRDEELVKKLQLAKEQDMAKIERLEIDLRRFFEETQLQMQKIADEVQALQNSEPQPALESNKLITWKDKILDNAKNHSEYKLNEVNEESASLLIRLGQFRLTVRFQKQTGCVESLDIEEPDGDKELSAFGQYIHAFFHQKIDAQCLESHIGASFSILSLLDHLECQITRFKETLKAVCHAGILYRARLDCKQQLTYRFYTSSADVEVQLDLSEFHMEKVQVKPIVREGPVRIRKILDIIHSIQRDVKFPVNVIAAIHGYLGGLKTR